MENRKGFEVPYLSTKSLSTQRIWFICYLWCLQRLEHETWGNEEEITSSVLAHYRKDMSLERRYNTLLTTGCLFWDIMGTNRAWRSGLDKRQNLATTCRIRNRRRCSYKVRILSSPRALLTENHLNITNPILNNEVKGTKLKPRKCSDIKLVAIGKGRNDVKLYTDCTSRNVPLFSNTLITSI